MREIILRLTLLLAVTFGIVLGCRDDSDGSSMQAQLMCLYGDCDCSSELPHCRCERHCGLTCEGSNDCRLTCIQSCNASCTGTGNCNVTMGAGGVGGCYGNGNCVFQCSGGACQVHCLGQGACTLYCPEEHPLVQCSQFSNNVMACGACPPW